MEPKSQAAKIMVASKPLNFYVYSSLVILGMFAFGMAMALIGQGDTPEGVYKTVAVTCLVMYLSYMIRFIVVRNYKPIRSRVLQAESGDEAWKIILGGYAWGLSAFAVVGATFYFSLKVFVL